MKKLLATTLLLAVPFAASATGNFTGWHVGGELNTVKYTMHGEMQGHSSQGAGIAVLGGYGFDFGHNFIGIVEAKVKAGNAKITDENNEVLKEKYQVSVAYLQGYRINDNILPYIKVGASASYLDHSNDGYENNGIRGFDYGAGVKYAVNENISVGVDFTRHNLHGQDNEIKFRGNQFGFNVTYHF